MFDTGGWSEPIPLLSLVDLVRGSEPGSGSYCGPESGVRFLRVGDISGKSDSPKYSRASDLVLVHKPDILFSLDGTPGVVVSGFEGAISSGIRRVDTKRLDLLLPCWLYHRLQANDIQKVVDEHARGSTILHASKAPYYISLRLPPLREQRRIAEILDAADDAIRQTERLIAKLKAVKAGLLHDLLTRGLDEHGHLRDPQAHPEQFKSSSLGRIPKEWEITTLGNVISEKGGIIQTGPFGSQLHAEEYTKEGIPVIMPQDIVGSSVSDEYIALIPLKRARDLARHRVVPNDVVLARRGDLSRCAPVGLREAGWLCGTGCLLVRPPEGVIHGHWLAAIYQHDRSQQQILARAVGSTMVNLNTSLLASLVIAKPIYEEQLAIMEYLDTHEARIRAEGATLEKLRQVKRGLMDDLLTGKVRAPV
jgi:type I restriction enzyme S subunit